MSTKRTHHPHHRPAHHGAHADAGQAHSYHINGRPPESELPEIDASKVMWLQQLLLGAGMPLAHGADGKYGFETHGAAKHIAQEAGIDLHTVNFNDPNNAGYKTFMHALTMHKQAHDPVKQALATGTELPAPAVAPVVAAPTTPAPAPVSRLGQYDPAHLATVSDAELNNILQDGLHGLREITGGAFGSYKRDGQLNELLVGKIHEQEKKLLGMDGKARREAGLDRATLERLATAMGEKLADQTHLEQYDRANLARASDTQLNNILKDGLHDLREIKGGILGSYHRNGELGDVTTIKVYEQERELLGVRKGNESMDRRTLEDTAAAMGQEIGKRTGLAPMDAALDQARNSGALPPQGAVANPQPAQGTPAPAASPRQPNSPLPAIY